MESMSNVKSQTDCGVDLEQLQLIQLCFGEHEFGVVIDNDIEPTVQIGDKSPEATSLQIGDESASAFDFDALLFVQEKLDHGVSLEGLCRDLDTYTSYLNNAILRHVNTDVHDAFVKVSGHLVGMQDELRCVQQPVIAATKKVEAAMSRLSALEEAVGAQIAEASDVELTRFFDVSFLKLLLLHNLLGDELDALPPPLRDEPQPQQQQSQRQTVGAGTSAHALSNAARARPAATATAGPLAIGAMSGAAAVAGSLHTRSALRGIAATLLQLKALGAALPQLAARAKEHAEAAALIASGTQRTHRAFAKAYSALHGLHAVSSAQSEALREVARVYRAADEVPEFCRMYREGILRPFLESVLSWRAATQARQSLEETIRLLVALRRELQEHVVPVLPLLRDAFDGAVLPVPMIIWPTVCEALVKKMVSLYDAGIPDAFQQRYVAAHDLLGLMEENCASAEELRALRQSPDVALWRHKWNTDVYSAMRANELGRRIDDAMKRFSEAPLDQIVMPLQQQQQQQQQSQVPQEEKCGGFHLEPFTVLSEGLDWLLSPGVYIYVATPKFLREAAAVSRRVAQGVASYCKSTQSTSALRDWLALLSAASADLTALAAHVAGPFRTRLEEVSGRAFPVSSTPLLQLIITDICDAHADEMRCAVQSRVVEECAAGLQNIRSVKSAYAHTKRPFPTAVSWYVPSILEPLQRFDAEVRTVLPPSGRQEALLAVADEVATRFRAIAKETLLTAKKTEESLEKLRRRKETAGRSAELPTETEAQQQQPSLRPTPATASDRDKMTLQLYLDSKSFVEELGKMTGIKCDSRPSMEALLKLLCRANWILGDDIPEPPDIDDESFS